MLTRARSLAVGLVGLVVLLVAGLLGTPARGEHAALLAQPPLPGYGVPFAAAGGAYFHPLTPARILDTRNGTGGRLGKVGGGQTVAVKVSGVGGVPSSGVTAVVMNVTVTAPTASSYLTVYPSDAARPNTSNLNFGKGQTVPNLVVVKAGSDGKVKVFNNAGETHVIFDVAGWYGNASGGLFNALTPARILDTRNGTGGLSGKVGNGQTVSVKVTGVGGVPSSGVTAVVMNVTVTAPTASSYLTVYPSDAGRPNTSNLNFVKGQTVPNLVVVKVGSDGKVKAFNNGGETHVIFDVAGWYGNASGGLFNALTPSRILDTRTGTGGHAGKLGNGATMSVQVTGAGGVPSSGVTAVVMNVTVTAPTANSYLTVYPSDAGRPNTSNLNFVKGQTVPNLVVVKVGSDGKVKAFNNGGETHVIFDVAGWFQPSGSQPTPTPKPPTPTPTRTATPTPTPSPVPVVAVLLADDGEFLGVVTCNKFDPDGIFNKFGTYGSKFSMTSIWNKFSQYGGRFGSYSPFNPFATPPIITDGTTWIYLTMEGLYYPKVTPVQLVLFCFEDDDYALEYWLDLIEDSS